METHKDLVQRELGTGTEMVTEVEVAQETRGLITDQERIVVLLEAQLQEPIMAVE